MKKRILWLLAAMLTVTAVLFAGRSLSVTQYKIETDKLTQDWKLAVLSDLHNKTFGDGNSQLLEKIADYGPDAILIAGDMVMQDDPDLSVVLDLCQSLIQIADVYYIYGNHEGTLQYAEGGLQIPLDRYLYETGVNVLYGGIYHIRHGDDEIALFAKSIDAESYRESSKSREQVETFLQSDGYKLAMSHFPDLFYDAMADMEFDLAVAGHYHGGQIILPWVGGLYHMDTGWFPEYSGGAYPLEYGTLVISRGLGNSTIVPRILNNPELVLIDIEVKRSSENGSN